MLQLSSVANGKQCSTSPAADHIPSGGGGAIHWLHSANNTAVHWLIANGPKNFYNNNNYQN